MNRFWRDPPTTGPATVKRPSTLAHLGGATPEDFTRAETRELFLALTAAIKGGARTKADVLAALPEHLREYAAWIDQSGALHGGTVDAMPDEARQKFAAESVTALRLLNVRRELESLQEALREDGLNPALLQRVGQLTAFVREATRAYPRAEGVSRSALGRERNLPKRAPVEVLRFRDRRAS